MKRQLITAASGLMLLGLAGCVSMHKSFPVNRIALTPLNRNEYKILGDTLGEACATYFLGGRFPWFSSVKTVSDGPLEAGNFLSSLPIFGMFFSDQPQVVQEATYEALDKIPGADALISMRVMHKKSYILFIYSEECATVQGKAFTIKTDIGSAE